MGKKIRRGATAATVAAFTAAALAMGGTAAYADTPVTPKNPQALDTSLDGNTGNQASFYRFASSNRVLTALFSAQNSTGWGTTAILASSADYSDALASAPLADLLNAPILLANENGSLDPQVKAYLATFENVIIVSGTGVIPQSTADAMLGPIVGDVTSNVVRISGVNRYETAAVISLATYIAKGGVGGIDFILADGQNFPDALAAGPAAAEEDNGLVLLTAGADGVSPATAALLTGHTVSWSSDFLNAISAAIDFFGWDVPPALDSAAAVANWFVGLSGHASVTVVGGAAQAAAENGLGVAWPGTAVEYDAALVGADRYETAAMVAGEYFGPFPTTYTVATGETFPDAVVAGGWAANAGGPLLLTRNATVPVSTMDYLQGAADNGDTFVVFGGTGSVSKDVSQELYDNFSF